MRESWNRVALIHRKDDKRLVGKPTRRFLLGRRSFFALADRRFGENLGKATVKRTDGLRSTATLEAQVEANGVKF